MLPLHVRYRLPALSLTRKELVELEVFLLSKAAPTSLRRLDFLHGFLTCVALSSSEIEQDQWLPLVWNNLPKVLPRFKGDAQEQRLTAYVLQMLDDIVLALADPDQRFSPLVARVFPHHNASQADGALWSSGFLLAMTQLEDHWRGLLATPDARCLMLPIFLLGSPFLPPAWDEMVQTLSQRDRLTSSLPAVVEAIHVQRFVLELAALKEARAVLSAVRQFQ